MATEDRTPEHDKVLGELRPRLLEVLRRVAPGGEVNEGTYAVASLALEVNLSYGRWKLADRAGSDPLELISRVVGFSHQAALAFTANALGLDLKELRKANKAAPQGKHRAVVPVPPEAIKLAWDTEERDELFWRRLGSSQRATLRFEYRDQRGRLLMYTCRFEGEGAKYFRRLAWFGPTIGWRLDDEKAHTVPRPWPLYGLQDLVARPQARVLVVEGEKTRDAAAAKFKDYVVVTWPGGVDSVEHCDWEPLRGRDVTLWPDADVYGREAMEKLQGLLRRVEPERVHLCKVAALALPQAWDLADPDPEGFGPREQADVLVQARSLPEWAAELNRQHFVVIDAGGTCVIHEDYDVMLRRTALRRLSFTDFRNFFDDRLAPGLDARGNVVNLGIGTLWLQHPDRRKFQGLVFDPSGEHPGRYNLWRGFAVKAVEGSCELFKQHVRDSICAGDAQAYEHLMNWMGALVQRPHRPAGSAVVLRGPRGVGKGTFVLALGRLFGEHFLHLSSPGLLTGRFNAHLRNAILVFADEAFWAGDRAGESFLKALVTEPTLTLEGKGRDAFTAPNLSHLVMASNHDWVVPAGVDERRFFVLDVKEDRAGDREYFKELRDELRSGGLEALLHELLNRDLAGWDQFVAPSTQALTEQKLLSLGAFDAWLLRRLREGRVLKRQREWPRAVTTDDCYADFLEEQGARRAAHVMNEISFGMSLNKFFKQDQRFRRQRDTLEVSYTDQQTGREVVKKERRWVYLLPPLNDSRRLFEAWLKVARPLDWGAPEGAELL